VRRWEGWTFVAGIVLGAGALFGVGWHINHENAQGPPAPTATSATTPGSSSVAAAALPASSTTSTTSCTPKGNVSATPRVAPDPTSATGYVASGTITNGRNDAISNALIYLSLRYSSGQTDMSHTHLVAGQIPPGATQSWSEPVAIPAGASIAAVAITQITYSDAGC